MITRRSLFGILAGAVAAPIVVRAGILMPVTQIIAPAPALVIDEHPFLTPTEITRAALRILHQKINFVSTITREIDATHWTQDSEGPDDHEQPERFLTIRMPNLYGAPA